MARPTWSVEQLDYLKDNYGPLTARSIGEHLGKIRNSVISKAQQLGLQGRTRPARPRRGKLPPFLAKGLKLYMDAKPEAPKIDKAEILAQILAIREATINDLTIVVGDDRWNAACAECERLRKIK